jgi:GT2 family glycosyltransferase
MLLRALQRVVRLAPGPVRWAWGNVPLPLRKMLGPLVYPIAAGKRGGTLIFPVPELLEARAYDVVVSSALAEDPRVAALRARGHRVIVAERGESVAAAAVRRSVLDGVLVEPPTDEVPERGARVFGLRCLPEARFRVPEDLDAVFPKATIVVVTWKNPELCDACLSAIRRSTPFPALELIVVDNGSGDGTLAMLQRRAAADPALTVIANAENRGFARGTNQGLSRAEGDYVVMLNDDTVPAPGWLSRLVAHLEAEPRLGLVCPVTNEIGNHARVQVSYRTLTEMEAFAAERARDHAGKRRETDTIALFCAAGRREELARLGFVDERYEIGMFEDDDLSLALRRAGLGLSIADDAFVHHVGQASFSRLSDAEYLAVWEANRRRFEEKWGTKYVPPESSST